MNLQQQQQQHHQQLQDYQPLNYFQSDILYSPKYFHIEKEFYSSNSFDDHHGYRFGNTDKMGEISPISTNSSNNCQGRMSIAIPSSGQTNATFLHRKPSCLLDLNCLDLSNHSLSSPSWQSCKGKSYFEHRHPNHYLAHTASQIMADDGRFISLPTIVYNSPLSCSSSTPSTSNSDSSLPPLPAPPTIKRTHTNLEDVDAALNTGAVSTKKNGKKRGKNANQTCHSCNCTETPEWRRGPDGARTLCNACGLHYAKLLKKKKHLDLTSKNSHNSVIKLLSIAAASSYDELMKTN